MWVVFDYLRKVTLFTLPELTELGELCWVAVIVDTVEVTLSDFCDTVALSEKSKKLRLQRKKILLQRFGGNLKKNTG